MPAATSTKQRVTITIPDQLADKYNERALKAGTTLEAEIATRLARCSEHTDPAPLYLTSEQRNRINIISGALIDSPESLINWALRLSRIKVQGVEITLDERLLSRIDSRRFGNTLAATIKRMVVEGLEEKVGMR
jgi:hypothetical protein